MGFTVTVNLDPGDTSWLRREARHMGVSMEEFVRLLIREKRAARQRVKPSEAFRRYFGPEHGVDLPLTDGNPYRALESARRSET